jgi:hypothetical protein
VMFKPVYSHLPEQSLQTGCVLTSDAPVAVRRAKVERE